MPHELFTVLHEMLGWLGLIFSLAGVVVSARYLRLSTWMYVVLGAFAAEFLGGTFTRLMMLAMRYNAVPGELSQGLFLIGNLFYAVASAALVIGLALVFRDVRERFHFMREMDETARVEAWKKSDAKYRASLTGGQDRDADRDSSTMH
jgi:hypothetical protein